MDGHEGRQAGASDWPVWMNSGLNLIKGANTQASLNLAEHEKSAIIAFLHTLTDQQFVAAEKFSDPFD